MRKYVIGILVVIVAAVLGFSSAYGAALIIRQRVATQTNTQNSSPNQSPNRRFPYGQTAPGQPGPQFRRNMPGFQGGQGFGPGFPGQRQPFGPGANRNNRTNPVPPTATPTPLPAQ
jgi:hypothetical protein